MQMYIWQPPSRNILPLGTTLRPRVPIHTDGTSKTTLRSDSSSTLSSRSDDVLSHTMSPGRPSARPNANSTGANANAKSPAATDGLMSLLMLVWLPAGVALSAFVLAYLASYYGGLLSGRCEGRVCQQWQHLFRAITGVVAACAALVSIIAVVLEHDRAVDEVEGGQPHLGATTTLVHPGGWHKLKPVSLRKYAMEQLRHHLGRSMVTPVGGNLPFCWHHLMLQLPHVANGLSLQLFFIQGYVWTAKFGWSMWEILQVLSVFSLTSAVCVALWTAATSRVTPARLAAGSCFLHGSVKLRAFEH
jgi:hypothetical protein